jgi:uncharacterized protein
MSPSADDIREFVIAGHGNLGRVKEMLAADPELLNAGHLWREGDRETAVQAAAHVGNAPIAEYLLAQGAPLAICTAAMLGRRADVEALLAGDPALIHAVGAHGIPLMAHAALSGDAGLAQMLAQRGASEGMSFALSNAVSRGHRDLARWLLENGSPDLGWQNYQGKTALAIALERGDEATAALMREHGAAD